MIRETASMMFLTTKTETEALLLEQNLIKQLKPRYNVLLRDDKSFPNILVSRAHAFPQIKKHRGKKAEKGRLLRSLRIRRRGEPDAEPAPEGLPSAKLFGRDLRQPHAPMSPLPDQALQRALRRLHRRGRLWSACRRRRVAFFRDGRPRFRPNSPRKCRRPAKRSNSNAPPRSGTASAR